MMLKVKFIGWHGINLQNLKGSEVWVSGISLLLMMLYWLNKCGGCCATLNIFGQGSLEVFIFQMGS